MLPETRTVVGIEVKSEVVPLAQETPTFKFALIVERDSDFGTVVEVGAFWMRTPPKGKADMLEPFPLTVASLMSKPAPSRRIPPAVLLLTLTWSR